VLETTQPDAADIGFQVSPATEQVCGAFVTLRRREQLRGCVGEIEPKRPIYEAVIAQAVNAGLHDHRFPPVTSDEIADLTFEVSVLTPPRRIASHSDIVLGKHGIVLRKNRRSAVFLPKVATEQGWTLEETLEQLARKATLAPSDWQDDAELFVFEAIVFREPAPGK
jgi:AmmeMemoRadiSam system protein A